MWIAAVLWDFGDTLVDERWMLEPPHGCPEWPAVWTDVMAEHADDWNTGRVTEAQIFDALAARSGMDVAAIERHAVTCCRSVVFHDHAWRAAVERRRPQALVTVNPDLFVDRVAAPYGLDAHFDTIVVSCVEGTDDKNELCRIALDRLAFRGARSEALLIDNRRDLVDAWAREGGATYHFRDDEQFAADWPSMLE